MHVEQKRSPRLAFRLEQAAIDQLEKLAKRIDRRNPPSVDLIAKRLILKALAAGISPK